MVDYRNCLFCKHTYFSVNCSLFSSAFVNEKQQTIYWHRSKFCSNSRKIRLINQHTVIADNRQIKFLYRGSTIYNFVNIVYVWVLKNINPVLEGCHFLVNFRNALIISKDSSCLMIRYSTTSYAIYRRSIIDPFLRITAKNHSRIIIHLIRFNFPFQFSFQYELAIKIRIEKNV